MSAITLKDLCGAIGANVHVVGDASKTVEKVVVGDLLSFVMGSESECAAWVTIQSHLNVAAVAVLKDIPIIIIAAGRKPSDDLSERCSEEGISLVTAEGSIFDVCLELGKLGLVG